MASNSHDSMLLSAEGGTRFYHLVSPLGVLSRAVCALLVGCGWGVLCMCVCACRSSRL